MITVFTPTYNRANYLGRTYESLLNQTYKSFEWIIVDDGSNDDTEEVVKSFISQNKLNIKYVYQINGGKHRAINLGAKISDGEWFFCLDSDDWLFDDGLEKLNKHIEEVVNKENGDKFFAVIGLCEDINGNRLGTTFEGEVLDVDVITSGIKYGVDGEKAWTVRTKLLVEYPFPEFEGEKFVTESTWYHYMTILGYIARYFNDYVEKKEFLSGGLCSNYVYHLVNSWQGTLLYFNNYFKYMIDYEKPVVDMLNFYTWVCKCGNKNSKEVIEGIYKNAYDRYSYHVHNLINMYGIS